MSKRPSSLLLPNKEELGLQEQQKRDELEELLKNKDIDEALKELLKTLGVKAENRPLDAERIVSLLKETTNNEKTKQIILENLKKEIRELYNLEEDLPISINNLEAKDRGISSFHKVVTFKKNDQEIILHAKNAATSSTLKGSKLCIKWG